VQLCPWFFADSLSVDQGSCRSAAAAAGAAAACGAPALPPGWGKEEEDEEEMLDALLASLEADPNFLGSWGIDPGHLISPNSLRMP
jgi:hypothetical protein